MKINKTNFLFICFSFLILKSVSSQNNLKSKSESSCIEKVKNYHTPFGEIEYPTMRYYSILTIIFIVVLILTAKAGFFLFENYIFSKYVFKTMMKVVEENFIIIFLISIISIFYLLSMFDSLHLNFQKIIQTLILFFLIFVISSLILIIISYLVTLKWDELEYNSKSFRHIKQVFNRVNDQEKVLFLDFSTENKGVFAENNDFVNKILNKGKKISNKYFYELMEYLVMKTYFIVPFFPLFKPGTLRNDFKLSEYLSISMGKSIIQIFEINFYSYILLFTKIILLTVFNSRLNQIIYIYTYPTISCISLILIYVYLKIVYRRIIPVVNQKNMNDFKDLNDINQCESTSNFTNYPLYIDRLLNNKEKIEEFEGIPHVFNGKISNFYDDIIIFGKIFFDFLMTIFRMIVLLNILWIFKTTSFIFKEYSSFQNNLLININISLLPIYFILSLFLIGISMKRYVILSNIEMSRNDETVRKTIDFHSKEQGKCADEIVNKFKKIYYDMQIKSIMICDDRSPIKKREIKKFNLLKGSSLCKMIDKVVLKYKGYDVDYSNNEIVKFIEDNIDFSYLNIGVKSDLKPFLKSIGNNFTDIEVDRMLYYIQDYENLYKEKKMSIGNLKEIWAVVMHFSSINLEDLILYVISKYYEERPELEESYTFDLFQLSEFMRWYKEYFSIEDMNFLLKELEEVNKHNHNEAISVDGIISLVLGMRKYYYN